MVKTAISLGLDVNAKNDDGDTAMHAPRSKTICDPAVPHRSWRNARYQEQDRLDAADGGALDRSRSVHTRPEAEELLRKVYAEHGVPVEIPTRDDAIEKLVNSKGGPVISCPAGLTVKATNGGRP